MSETKSPPNSIDDYLKAIAELEAKIEEQRQERTAMFIDLVGYTSFVDRHGDIAGLRRVEAAGKIVVPTCESFEGHLVKQIGDEWMILFVDPIRAVQAAMEIQERMAVTQKNAPTPIRVKVGAHYGKLLLHAQDAFGDVVNMASRLVGLCTGDDILISRSIYDEVGPFYQRRCAPLPELRLRGKADLAEAYELDWKPIAVAEAVEEKVSKLMLEVRWGEKSGSIALRSSEDEDAPLVSKSDHRIQAKEIAEVSHSIWETVRSANRSALGKRASGKVEELGQQLFGLLFPPTIQERLRAAEEEFLVLDLDDSCVHIPWEVAHDGKDFLCSKFSLGRKARTGQRTRGRSRAAPDDCFTFLVVSNPTGDLPAASEEGRALYDLCRNDNRVRLNWQNHRVTCEKVRDYLPEYDVLHYCGHAEHIGDHPDQSGWVLAGGDFKASELEVFMREERPIPRLVFNNACHSGTTGSWEEEATGWSYGLANAFLLAGCVHYIGAVAELLDQGSKDFSRFFYHEVMAGHPVGRALRKARMEYRKQFGSENLTWVQYVLYGNPEIGLFKILQPPPPKKPRLQFLIDGPSSEHSGCSVHLWAITAEPKVRSFEASLHTVSKGSTAGNVIPLFLNDSGSASDPNATGSAGFRNLVHALCDELHISEKDRFIREENGAWRFKLDNSETCDRFAARTARGADGDFASKEIYATETAYRSLPKRVRGLYGQEENQVTAPGGEIATARGRKNLDDPRSPNPLERALELVGAHKELAALILVLSVVSVLITIGIFTHQKEVVQEGQGQGGAFVLAATPIPAAQDMESLVAKGIEEMNDGHLETAEYNFAKALKIDPDNMEVRNLRDSVIKKIRIKEAENKAARKTAEGRLQAEETDRTLKLLDDYARRVKENPPPAITDAWTSGPVAIAVIRIEEPLGPPWDESEIAGFNLALEESLGRLGRWKVITRAEIQDLLTERSIQASQLTSDNSETYTLAGLAGARALVFGGIDQKEGKNEAWLRVVDISRSILALETHSATGALPDLAPGLVEKTLPALEKEYAPQGRVVEVGEESVTLNIGALQGVRVGDRLEVYPKESHPRAADRVVGLTPIGELEVLKVEETASLCRILSAETDLTEGMRAVEQ